MNYNEVVANAKKNIDSDKCKVCRVCNGVACRGVIPGPGGKGTGEGFTYNRERIDSVRVRMDVLYAEAPVDTSAELFGRRFDYPVFAAPIGALKLHYGPYMEEEDYVKAVVTGCAKAGSAAFTGDGLAEEVFIASFPYIQENGGAGIPTLKPWPVDEMIRKARLAEECGCVAVASDVDAAGLQLLKNTDKPAGPKSVTELSKVISSVKIPFIIKGVMTVEGARKACDAGAYGIVVSNHGGRVLDCTEATIDALATIAGAMKGKLKLFVDGGFRTGTDAFKALALGADAVLIGRPYVTAAYGGGAEGVELYTRMVGEQLRDTMLMTGATTISAITREMVAYRP